MRLVSILVLLAPFVPLRAQQTGEPLPLDLAFARRELRDGDVASVSPDGRWLAYEMHIASRSPAGDDLVPGAGVRLFVVSTEGGEAVSIGPDGADCWRPAWSTDGRRLAFYARTDDGQARLWIHDVALAKSHELCRAPIKVRAWPMDTPSWCPNGRDVIVPLVPAAAAAPADAADVAAAAGSEATPPGDAGRVEVHDTATDEQAAGPAPAFATDLEPMRQFLIAEHNAAIAAVDVATGVARIVVAADAEPRPSLARMSPDGRWLACESVFDLPAGRGMATFVHLSLVPIDGGAPQVVARDLETTQRTYAGTTCCWTPDGHHLVFTRDHHVWVVDVTAQGGAAPRRLDAVPDAVADLPFALTADGRSLLVGVATGDDRLVPSVLPEILTLVPLAGGAAVRLPGGWPLTAGGTTLWQPDSGALHLLQIDPKNGERALVRVALHDRSVTKVAPCAGRFRAVGAGPDGSLIARLEGIAAAPDFYRLDAALAPLGRLTHIEPTLDRVVVGPMHTFATQVPGPAGKPIEVQSAVFLPSGVAAEPRLPTVVYLYPGAPLASLAQDYGGGAPNTVPVQIFATRGYAVLLVDVPVGPMGRPGNPLAEIAAAVLPQVRRSVELGYSDPDRVAILGHSYGAYGAVGVVTQSDTFRAAIAIDGFYDVPGAYGTFGRGGVAYNVEYFEAGQARMGGHPWAERERYLANSPYYQAERIHTPLLLLHGGMDEDCAPAEARKMFAAMQRLGRTAQLAIYAAGSHSPEEWPFADRVDAAPRMLAFLERHLSRKQRQ